MGIKVGLIGAGSIAQGHLNALQQNKNVDEISIADTNEAAIKRAQQAFPKAKKAYADYREMLKDLSIKAVDICVPHWLHHRLAIDSLKAGKDVICEKPIAMTLKEADDMIGTAKKLGRRLFIEMNQRFMPYHKETKKLLDSGAIGKPFLVVYCVTGNCINEMNDPNYWKASWEKAGGGVMIDTGYHVIYTMLHFFGRPIAVTGTARKLLVKPANKADDNTAVIFEFENNVLGSAALSYTVTSDGWMETRNIYGTDGSIHIKDTSTDQLTLIKANQPKVIPTEQPVDVHPHSYSLMCAVNHFVDCIITGKECEVKPEEAKDALKVALAIYESSNKGKRILLKW